MHSMKTDQSTFVLNKVLKLHMCGFFKEKIKVYSKIAREIRI